MTKNELVRLVCGYFYVEDKTYPQLLPQALQEWYCYCSDGGHCIVSVLQRDYKDEGDLTEFLVPIPVKTVKKGYSLCREYVVVDVPYSPELGLITPPEDDEF